MCAYFDRSTRKSRRVGFPTIVDLPFHAEAAENAQRPLRQ
jgi:hypothetical protein